MPDARILNAATPGRFVERRFHRAGQALCALGKWELSAYVAQIKPIDLETLRALSGSAWACAYEWNAALAQRALQAPLMTGMPADD